MRTLLASAALATIGTLAFADEDNLVVVELYTSEGCSSCPPADEILTKLAEQDNILALALHVDYWDYLGWKDEFAMAKFTKRQEVYNAVLPRRYRLVTPQMVFHGRSQVAGAKPTLVTENLEKLANQEDMIEIDIQQNVGDFRVTINPKGVAVPTADVFIVHYDPEHVSKIKAGENRGRTLVHTNVVTAWDHVGEWSGQRGWHVNQAVTAGSKAAVIVQAAGNGPILAARHLR